MKLVFGKPYPFPHSLWQHWQAGKPYSPPHSRNISKQPGPMSSHSRCPPGPAQFHEPSSSRAKLWVKVASRSPFAGCSGSTRCPSALCRAGIAAGPACVFLERRGEMSAVASRKTSRRVRKCSVDRASACFRIPRGPKPFLSCSASRCACASGGRHSPRRSEPPAALSDARPTPAPRRTASLVAPCRHLHTRLAALASARRGPQSAAFRRTSSMRTRIFRLHDGAPQ